MTESFDPKYLMISMLFLFVSKTKNASSFRSFPLVPEARGIFFEKAAMCLNGTMGICMRQSMCQSNSQSCWTNMGCSIFVFMNCVTRMSSPRQKNMRIFLESAGGTLSKLTDGLS